MYLYALFGSLMCPWYNLADSSVLFSCRCWWWRWREWVCGEQWEWEQEKNQKGMWTAFDMVLCHCSIVSRESGYQYNSGTKLLQLNNTLSACQEMLWLCCLHIHIHFFLRTISFSLMYPHLKRLSEILKRWTSTPLIWSLRLIHCSRRHQQLLMKGESKDSCLITCAFGM